jgi:hypothetical protein
MSLVEWSAENGNGAPTGADDCLVGGGIDARGEAAGNGDSFVYQKTTEPNDASQAKRSRLAGTDDSNAWRALQKGHVAFQIELFRGIATLDVVEWP